MPRMNGVSHSNSPAAAHRMYCVFPPSAPPASTTKAATRLYGARVRIALATEAAVARMKSPAWIMTMTRYARPNARPELSKALGTDSARTKYAAIPPSSSSRREIVCALTAFISHA